MSEKLLKHFDLLATAPDGVARLRELILTLAVQGKLVHQDPTEAPVDLSLIPDAIQLLVDEGKVPRSRSNAEVQTETFLENLPNGWVSVVACNVFIPRSGNSKLIKGKLFSEAAEHLFPGYSASGQDVWLPHYEYEGTAVILSAVGARCGKAFLAKEKWSAVANTHIIWPLLEIVLPEYSMLLLNNEGFWIRSGGAQPFVKVTETLQRPVLLPPLAEQARIVARVGELMRLCDALEAKGKLDAAQHTQLVQTLLGTLTDSASPAELAANWQRVAEHFDLLLDRPEAVDALEQTILQHAVRGLLVPQDPNDEPASVLLQRIRTEKDRLIADGKIKRDKPLPPIADEEKPFELPQGWQAVRLADVVRVLNGRAYNKQELLESGPTPVLRVGNLFTSNHWYYSNLELEPDKYCVKGDLLYAWSASFGPFIWDGPKAIYHYHIWKLEPWAANHFDTGYFHKFLDEKTAEIKAAGHGVSMVHMTKEKMEKIVVPLPPLAEQIRIAGRVEELRQLCNDMRQRLSASRTTQGHLAEALVADAARKRPTK